LTVPAAYKVAAAGRRRAARQADPGRFTPCSVST
jgi:hypothetical protein